jgi:hypothetical protein
MIITIIGINKINPINLFLIKKYLIISMKSLISIDIHEYTKLKFYQYIYKNI